MMWNTDDELGPWIHRAANEGGGFVRAVAEASMRADEENYLLIRPLLVELKVKYPRYGKP